MRDLHLKVKDLEKAVQLFEKAHRSRPDDYQAIALRALALHELGRADEAREADQEAVHFINKYLQVNPNEARAYSLGASPLARLGENASIQSNGPNNQLRLRLTTRVVLYNAACNLAQLGEHESALNGLERSIEAGVAVRDWIKKESGSRKPPRSPALPGDRETDHSIITRDFRKRRFLPKF